jgi:hypothetical protein
MLATLAIHHIDKPVRRVSTSNTRKLYWRKVRVWKGKSRTDFYY